MALCPTPSTVELAERFLALVDPDGLVLVGVVRHRRSLQILREPNACLEDLLGRRVPDCWSAVGILAPGQIFRIGDLQARRVSVAHVLRRHGPRATAINWGDSVELLKGGTGRVADLLDRMLGLDTPPPTLPPMAFLAHLWIDRILAAVLGRSLGSTGPSALEVSALRPEPVADWAELRRRCSAGLLDLPGISPATAEWLDEGSLHRLAEAALPDQVEIVADLRQLLSPDTLGYMGLEPATGGPE